MSCPCRPVPDDRCPSKKGDSLSCSLPAGHHLPHAKCVHTPSLTEHRFYTWWGLCHEEVIRDGMFAPCDRTAATTRTDPEDGHEYPVCRMHRTRSPEGATS